jgi:hypothetical protein
MSKVSVKRRRFKIKKKKKRKKKVKRLKSTYSKAESVSEKRKILDKIKKISPHYPVDNIQKKNER